MFSFKYLSAIHCCMQLMLFSSITNNIVVVTAQEMQMHEHYMPLMCNTNIATVQCQPFTTMNFDLSQTVVIPCGTCVTMDILNTSTSGGNEQQQQELVFQQGLDIQGKLVFPSSTRSSNLKIITPYVFVQGELVIEPLSEKIIPQLDKTLEFHFVGTTDVTFVSHPMQMNTKCAAPAGCNVSKKPFLVAGGNVDIQGMDDTCSTWTRLASVQDAGPANIDDVVPSAPVARDGCSPTLIREDFESSTLADQWDGIGAGSAVVENGYYSVSLRTSGTQGPRVYLPVDCITPNAEYILKLRYRYRHTSSTKAAFTAPYVKMVKYNVDGTNNWLSADVVHGRGTMGMAPVNEWQQLERAIIFDDFMADSSFTSALTLYISPYDDADIIDIDDFVLELVPSNVYEGRSCDSLLVNGQVGSEFAYPFYSAGGMINVMDAADGPTINNVARPYLRNTLRTSKYSSPFAQDIYPECIVAAAIYEFSAYVRVNSDVATSVTVALRVNSVDKTVAVCPPSSNNWVHCTARIRLTEADALTTSANIRAYVANDDTSDVDMTDVSFVYKGGRANKLTLEDSTPALSGCWGPGAEILVTSHTIRAEDSQVATIQSIASNGDLILDSPIHKPITIQDDPNTAVEVALLSRNIKFTAAEDDVSNPLHGAHFIIMHTPAPTVQTIIGVESHGFGQQGKLGRYPFHFHMCNSVLGSVVSKNSVRNTKQRAIVVHGTDDLYLEGNVIHNVRGHGFMLEDGAEQGNKFIRNLGAVSLPVDTLISNDESDNLPSTFWITNPQNTWQENVAAGSHFSGFWFEVKTRVRGPSRQMFPDMIPNQLDLLKFTDNVSHSNRHGLQTYPQTGYRPPNVAVFENHMSFRNRESGVFFHAGGRLAISGGYLSDNSIGVDIDMDHSDIITNTVIVGTSQAYQQVMDDMGYEAQSYPATDLCLTDKSIVGVRLDSYHSGSLFNATGTQLSGVTFSGFERCKGAALHVDDKDIQYFDTRHHLQGVVITDNSPAIDLCEGEPQVAIYDSDGSIGGTPGFLISDTGAINAHPACSTAGFEGSCAAFCPGVCFRTLTVKIPSDLYHPGQLKIRVSGEVPMPNNQWAPITPVEIEDNQYYLKYPKQDTTHGRLFVTLPAGGRYTAQIFDKYSSTPDQVIFPTYTDLQYEDVVGNCGPDFESFSIEEPVTAQCDGGNNIVINGDFASGTSDHWRYMGHLGLEVDGTSLKAPNQCADGPCGAWVGPAQYLDTRCFNETGYRYYLTAKVKLTDSSGANYVCNLSDGSCPLATVRYTNHLAANGAPVNQFMFAGRLETTDQEWNILSGSFTVDSNNVEAHSVMLYINGAPANINIHIDDVVLTREHPSSVSTPSTPLTTLYEVSNENSILVNAEETVVEFNTDAGLDSTIMTTIAHEGDIELVVKLSERDILQDGYQPHLVLFFAPEDVTIDQVTTNDNLFATFEDNVVAWTKEKIYHAMDHTWFQSKTRDASMSGSFYTGNAGKAKKFVPPVPVDTSALPALKLKRSTAGGGNKVSSYYSFDSGTTWTMIGTEIELPATYAGTSTSALKVGYRIKREWKSMYHLVTLPELTVDNVMQTS